VNAVGVELFARAKLTQIIASQFGDKEWSLFSRIFSQRSYWAAAFATELAIINNFSWNNVWTFRRRAIRGLKIVEKFLHFNLTSIGAIILQSFALGAATLMCGDTPFVRQIALILAIGLLVVPYNWTMYNLVIWNKNGEKNK
jgi:putative flippase GtrA